MYHPPLLSIIIFILGLNALTEEVRVKMQIMNAEAAGPKKREPTAVPTELKKVSNEINKYLKTKYLDNWPKVK